VQKELRELEKSLDTKDRNRRFEAVKKRVRDASDKYK
jgi:hypothetical protein